MDLEKILLDLGIEQAKDKEEIQSRVAKAISIYLQSEPVLSTIEIRKALVRLADKGKIPFLGKEYGPAWPCNGTYSDSENSYIKQDIRENKYSKMRLSEIVKIILEDKHQGSKITVNSISNTVCVPLLYVNVVFTFAAARGINHNPLNFKFPSAS